MRSVRYAQVNSAKVMEAGAEDVEGLIRDRADKAFDIRNGDSATEFYRDALTTVGEGVRQRGEEVDPIVLRYKI
jgi:hypothetical protein